MKRSSFRHTRVLAMFAGPLLFLAAAIPAIASPPSECGGVADTVVLAAPVEHGTGNVPYNPLIADIDRDGKADLLVASFDDGLVSVLRGHGDGSFEPRVDYPCGAGPDGMEVVDLDRDGWPDIVTSNRDSGSLSVLINDGDGTFAPPVQYPVLSAPFQCVAADFDRDGRLDVAVVNNTADQLSVLPGNGDGTLGSRTDYATGAGPGNLVAGDFDGDGVLDLVVANGISETVSLFKGSGAGAFAAAVDRGTEGPVVFVTSGDYDRDGRLDLAWLVVRSGVDDSVAVVLGNGDGTFGARITYVAGGWLDHLATADMNRDGRLDLVVGDWERGQVAVLLGRGDGTFEAPQAFATTGQPNLLAIGDVDGDGRPDVAATVDNGNSVAVLLGRRDTGFLAVDPPASGTARTALTVRPNPSRGPVELSFALSAPGAVRVSLYDVTGRLVTVVADGWRPAGRHDLRWNGRRTDGSLAPAGVYLAVIRTHGELRSERVVVTR